MRVFQKKTNFQKDILEKVYRLADLLRTIYDDEFLTGKLVIKGGTAINFIYFNMPRLSVDIDLNFVSGEQREDMLKSRENIDKILTKIITMNGYENEQKFIESFYEQKNADMDLLFEDMRYNPQLKEHPMIGWRMKNM